MHWKNCASLQTPSFSPTTARNQFKIYQVFNSLQFLIAKGLTELIEFILIWYPETDWLQFGKI